MFESRLAPRKGIYIKGLYEILEKSNPHIKFYNIGIKVPMQLLDISISGCAFKTSNFLPKGLYLELKLKSFPASEASVDIIITGEIIYCKYLSQTNYRVGFHFLKIEKKHQNFIDKYVSESA